MVDRYAGPDFGHLLAFCDRFSSQSRACPTQAGILEKLSKSKIWYFSECAGFGVCGSNASSYIIQGGLGSQINNWVADHLTSTSVKIKGLANGSYRWRVKSVCNTGEESACWSFTNSFRVDTCINPYNLQVTVNPDHIVKLDWDIDGFTSGYIVKGGLIGQPAVKIKAISYSLFYKTTVLPPGSCEWRVQNVCLYPYDVSKFSAYNLFAVPGVSEKLAHHSFSEREELIIYPGGRSG